MSRWAGRNEPVPYPPDRGVKARMMELPVDRPEPPPDPPPLTGKDGKARSPHYLRRSLGLPPLGRTAPDDQVHDWTEV